MNGVGLACFQNAQKSATGMHSVGAGGCSRRVEYAAGAHIQQRAGRHSEAGSIAGCPDECQVPVDTPCRRTVIPFSPTYVTIK